MLTVNDAIAQAILVLAAAGVIWILWHVLRDVVREIKGWGARPPRHTERHYAPPTHEVDEPAERQRWSQVPKGIMDSVRGPYWNDVDLEGTILDDDED